MKIVKRDLSCYRGQTFSQNIYFSTGGKPYSLDGYVAKSQIRPSENSPTLTAEFVCTVDAENGKLNLYLPSEVTATMHPSTYVWDLKVTKGADVDYLVAGKFTVSGRVTE